MDHSDSNEQSKPNNGRGNPDKKRPWCWIEKAILRMIADIFDATGDANLTRSVYLALCEIASDKQANRFTVAIAEIAKRACVSYRKTLSLLQRFETLKIIEVQRNIVEGTKELAPSTYTLCTGCITLCTDAQHGSMPRVYKNKRKIRKNDDKKRAQEPPAPATTTATEEATASSSIVLDSTEEAEKHPYWKQFKAYCRSRSGSPTVKGFSTWLKKQPPLKSKASSPKRNGAVSYEAASRASMERADREAARLKA